MNINKIDINEQTPPRYEYRTFGHNFSETQRLMEELTQPVPDDLKVRVFNEIYIVSKKADNINVKIRNDLLDVKKQINIQNKLERWDAVKKYEFPISKDLLVNDIFPQLKADIPLLKTDELDLKGFISIAKRHKDIMPISVHKKRFAYLVNFTICEFADIIIGNDYLYTVSVESTDPNEVITTVDQLGLKEFENINYIQAIKRLNGLVKKPLVN